jgi:hypothetical protein
MYHLLMNLPVFATLGVVSVLAGPLAELVIDAGAWVLEKLVYAGALVVATCVCVGHNHRS